MAKGVSISVKGLDQIRKKFGKLPESLSVQVDAEMASVANDFVNGAVAAAPVDQGLLKNSITFDRIGSMNYRVVSAAEQSPYIEFGTRSRVKVPSGLQAYAAQFRQKTGRKGAKKAIFDWCKRKGLPQDAWFPIFISIMTNGIEAKPFFFPQLPIAQVKLSSQLKEAVAKALK